MAKIILLSVELGNDIFTRNTISAFFEKINLQKETEIILDFRDVKFISRSCADEYFKQKEKSKKKIIERNLSFEVRSMFKVVENQYDKAGYTILYVTPYEKNELVV